MTPSQFWSCLHAAAMLLAGCGLPETQPNELLFTNGVVVTDDESGTAASSVLVRDGLVARVGDSATLTRSSRSPIVVDLRGTVLAPAFVDHHVHLVNVGFALLNARDEQRLFLDVSDVQSLDELAERVRSRAAATVPGQWILGAGWSQASWGTQALPSHEPLTRGAPEHPVFLARTDGHAGWVNAAAMRLANLDASTADPSGGEIVRSSGAPTGVLLERANESVIRLIPTPSDEDIKSAFRLAADALASRGVSDVYDAGVLAFPGVVALNVDLHRYLRLLQSVDIERPLPINVNLMIPAPSKLADSLTSNGPFDPVLSPRLRITHLKLFADGALGSRGAALSHRYADDPTTSGVLRMIRNDIYEWARRALDVGLSVATHAIGDEAVRQTLDAYDRLLDEDVELDPGRLRIEHFSYARAEDFERAAALGVVLSIQSNFNSPPTESPTFGERRVGSPGSRRVYAWRALGEMEATLAEGSDYFTTPGPPLMSFHTALTRVNGFGMWGEGRAGRIPAFRLATTWFPAEGGQARTGTVSAGEPANLVILSADPLTVAEDSLLGIRVLATFRQGKLVYDDGLIVGDNSWRVRP